MSFISTSFSIAWFLSSLRDTFFVSEFVHVALQYLPAEGPVSMWLCTEVRAVQPGSSFPHQHSEMLPTPVCFLSSGYVAWRVRQPDRNLPTATCLLKWSRQLSPWHFCPDLLSAQYFPLYFNWSSHNLLRENYNSNTKFKMCLLCARSCSKHFTCINSVNHHTYPSR